MRVYVIQNRSTGLFFRRLDGGFGLWETCPLHAKWFDFLTTAQEYATNLCLGESCDIITLVIVAREIGRNPSLRKVNNESQ